MIKIAIIDDEENEQEHLRACCAIYAKEVCEELEIHIYSDGMQFLEHYNHSYDLLFLDIDMPKRNGIDVAKKIRQLDNIVLIIFVTKMAQMAIRGYEVQALDFILKPVNYYSFAMKMRNVINLVQARKKDISY